MNISEIVYLGRDNTIDLEFGTEDGVSNLSTVTRIVLKDASCNITIDSDTSPDAFDWSTGDGMIIFSLGNEDVDPGKYLFYVIIYEPSNVSGIVWGSIEIRFKDICSGG